MVSATARDTGHLRHRRSTRCAGRGALVEEPPIPDPAPVMPTTQDSIHKSPLQVNERLYPRLAAHHSASSSGAPACDESQTESNVLFTGNGCTSFRSLTG